MSAPEIIALLDKSRASLTAANLLLDNGFPGFAVSRAYYAMFYAAEALLLSSGQRYSSHRGVISALGRDYAATGVLDRELHAKLVEAFRLRQAADYATGGEILAEEAADTLALADRFIAWVEQYLREPEGAGDPVGE
jgi:uncharacterized protein (UPF0332 family)